MYISKIKVQNYKAFYDSGWIEFKPGINIISGQNNSGKTALLEALSLKFNNITHRSLKTLPTRFENITQNSEIYVSVKFTKDYINSLIDNNSSRLLFPFPSNNQPLNHLVDAINRRITDSHHIEISIPLDNKGINFKNFPSEKENLFRTLGFNAYAPKYPPEKGFSKSLFMVAMLNLNSGSTNNQGNSQTSLQQYEDLFALKPFVQIKEKIYRFYAERMNVGICQFGDNRELKPDASNLAEVLNCLQSINPSRFYNFNELVSVVLPHIKRITVLPRPGTQVEIMVWSVDSKTERDDLAFPLSASGTGVSQVLAILYILITSQEPRTIIIDEPQSFLHPGAARKLIEILQDCPQHQYFISTHSPSIISAANPSTITLLKYQDSEATPISISADDSDEMRSLLDEVGVHLSDVFGSDNILWVEGPTEERCFPIILKKIANIPLRGTQILALKNTGDLEGRKSEIYFDIYDRLSGGKGLLPPAVGFILDSENKSEKDRADLERRSGDKLDFLDRCMCENYLLVPEAITAIANQYNFRDENISVSEIEQWIVDQKQNWIGEKTQKDGKEENSTDDCWLKQVHAAKLLENLFKHFSDGKVIYRKTTHSVKLTEWIVENKPEQLQDIADLLKNVLGRTSKVNSPE